ISTGNQDFYLIKIDSDGNELSTKTFGNSTSGHPFDWCNFIAPTKDSSYVLVGNSDVDTILDIYVVKTDASGNKTWIKNFGEPFYDYGNSVVETNDGSYLIGGTTKSAQGCNNDIALLLINADGNEIWKKSIGGSGADWGNAVCQTNDGSFAVAGHTNSYGAGKFDVLLMKIPNLNPRFNALPNSGHQPLQVEFQDQSTGDVSSWQWDFDDDGTIDSHEQNPAWVYNQAGTYSVRLMISSNAISDTVIQQDFIRVFDGQSALQFYGKNSAVSCPASSSLNLTEKFSIEAWIHPFGWGKAGAMGMGRIVDKKNFVLYLINSSSAFKDHSLALQLKHADNSMTFSTSPDSSIDLTNWQHVAVTYDGNTNQVAMYINGVAQSLSQTRTPSGFVADHANENLMIGNNSTRGYTFDGIIDEVRIWNVVRTPEEIQTNMNSCFTKAQPGLIGCWSLNEGNGDIIIDLSGNQNDGTTADVTWVQSISLTPTHIKKAGQNSQLKNFVLYPNYPNPFNSSTSIRFDLPRSCQLNLNIYDLTGRLVKSLIQHKKFEVGIHSIQWSGMDEIGNRVSSGVYLYKLQSGDFSQVRKLALVK
ncbi:PKD domain-containing protein, partial [candidate division KSB1 bacterium]|nr:PKD domain-containing protein [candidate division KSB1 bacterium]